MDLFPGPTSIRWKRSDPGAKQSDLPGGDDQGASVDQGFTNLLVELHQQFNILDLDSDLAEYKLVILPDEIRPSPRLIAALEAYLDKDGALFFSGRSLLKQGRFALLEPACTIWARRSSRKNICY